MSHERRLRLARLAYIVLPLLAVLGLLHPQAAGAVVFVVVMLVLAVLIGTLTYDDGLDGDVLPPFADEPVDRRAPTTAEVQGAPLV